MEKFLKRVNLLFYQEPNSDLSELLVELFADVHCVGSNEDAIGIYQKHYIDVIVIEIDTMIEEKLKFLSVVKNKNLFSLIITVSKEENLNTISKFIKIGLDSYIKKPFGKEFFIDT